MTLEIGFVTPLMLQTCPWSLRNDHRGWKSLPIDCMPLDSFSEEKMSYPGPSGASRDVYRNARHTGSS